MTINLEFFLLEINMAMYGNEGIGFLISKYECVCQT